MRVEWPTLVLIAVCYALWVGALWLPVGMAIVALGLIIALHASLQHEVLHGHPFAHRTASEALVYLSLNLAIPYPRFRDTHLAHHHDASLTDPYDDPETNYLDPQVWACASRCRQGVLRANNTLLGRMLIGPVVSQIAFMGSDARAIARGDLAIARVWVIHLVLSGLLLWLIALSPLPVWAYLLACYAGLSILKIRTFLEHQAHEACPERTVIIEDRGLLSFLFLNNNFHAVHHLHPQVPWYHLPGVYAANKARYLRRNGGYHYTSYAPIFRRYLTRAKDPVAHPHYRARP